MIRYENGVMRERWDDPTRIYTAWDATGVQTTQRPYTAAENAAADAAAADATATINEADLETKARTALTNNATFLAIASPTTAQAVTQVKALTRQVNALIRLEIGELQAVDGT